MQSQTGQLTHTHTHTHIQTFKHPPPHFGRTAQNHDATKPIWPHSNPPPSNRRYGGGGENARGDTIPRTTGTKTRDAPRMKQARHTQTLFSPIPIPNTREPRRIGSDMFPRCAGHINILRAQIGGDCDSTPGRFTATTAVTSVQHHQSIGAGRGGRPGEGEARPGEGGPGWEKGGPARRGGGA